jgi:hypothetical protein
MTAKLFWTRTIWACVNMGCLLAAGTIPPGYSPMRRFREKRLTRDFLEASWETGPPVHTLVHRTLHASKAFDLDEEVGAVRNRANEVEARLGCCRDLRSASQGTGDENGSEQATIHERPFERGAVCASKV